MPEPPHSPPPPPPLETLAERLDYLFRTVHPQGHREYSYREVAAGIRAQGGPPTLSSAYLWQLRTGQSTDPRRSYLEAIARFFDVPVGFFFGGETSLQLAQDLPMLSAIRDESTREVALRAHDLSADAKAGLLALIDLLRRLEGVPDRLQRRRGGRRLPRSAGGAANQPAAAGLPGAKSRRRRARSRTVLETVDGHEGTHGSSVP